MTDDVREDEPATAAPDAAGSRRVLTTSAGTVLRRALGTDVARLLAADPVAREGDDTEGVHQARVAVRRLRSQLTTFSPILQRDAIARLVRDLRWLGRSLGSVRDLDVLRARLVDTVRQFDPLTREDGLALVDALDAERAACATELEDVLASKRYRRLAAAIGRVVAEPPFRRSAGLPAESFLHEVIHQQLGEVEAAVSTLAASPSDEELHEVRIAARPLRYLAEVSTPVLGASCGRLAKRITALCDELGDLHDGARANQWLDGVAATEGAAYAVARVRAAEIGRMADARGAWVVAWERAKGAAADLGVPG